jgi:predicted PurR-regulated permease PerM
VALCVLALLMGATTALGAFGLPPLLHQLQSLLADLHGAVADFVRTMVGTHSVQLSGSSLDAQRLADLIAGGLQQQLTGPQLLRLAGWGAAGLFGFMLMWVLIGYFLLDSRAIAAGLRWLVPPRQRARAELIWRELDPLLRRYFIGVAAVVAYRTRPPWHISGWVSCSDCITPSSLLCSPACSRSFP